MREDEKAERISIYERFELIEDPRDNRGKRYKLIDLLIMVIYGILSGYDDFDNMADYLSQKASYFRTLLLIEKTPSHDCHSDIFGMIDAKKFMEMFVEWVKEIIKERTGLTIAIDGKAIRSAREKINGGNTPYIISGYLTEVGLSIGEVEVSKKSNEVKAIP